MRALVLGVGNVGSYVVNDLIRDFEVVAADHDLSRLRRFEGLGAEVLSLDASSPESLVRASAGFDVVVDSLPGSLGFRVLKALVESGINVVDVSFMPEDPLPLRGHASSSGSIAVVDAGFAPGLSNLLIGHASEVLGGLDEGVILVGGLPERPEPPLYHAALFSLRDLIDEYLRPARMVRGGEVVSVDPLSQVTEVSLRGFKLEAFPTDGLRTLLKTVKARDLSEWTLRWPGHLSRMRVLKELGFLEGEGLECSLKVLKPLLKLHGRDMSLMKVYAGRGSDEVNYFMLDEGGEVFTSMARVTGSVASVITRLVAEGRVEPGLHPLEDLGRVGELYEVIIEGLRSRGVFLEVRE